MSAEDHSGEGCGYKGAAVSRKASSQLAQTGSPSTKVGHPFVAASISFLARRWFTAVPCARGAALPAVYCWEGSIIITPDWSRPFLSLPSFVSAVQTAFCHSCQWSFQKQESLASSGHSESVQYIWCLEHQTNACAHSAEIIPDKRRLWPCGEYERNGDGKLPAKSKKRLFLQPGSPVRKGKCEAVWTLPRAQCPQPPWTVTVPREAVPCQSH